MLTQFKYKEVEIKYFEYIENIPGMYPYYIFLIIVCNQEVGKLIVRKQDNGYDGHIGYTISPYYRGNNYAFKAVMASIPFLKQLKIEELVITCSPNNIASKKTIEKLGLKYVDTKIIPRHLKKQFAQNETSKMIYKISVNEL